MLEKVKTALRIVTDAFNGEITDLIAAAKADLQIAGVTTVSESDPLINRAIILYCRMHFGQPDDFDKIAESYRSLKARIMIATGYTDYGSIG